VNRYVICIFAFNRHEDLDKCLQALELCEGLNNFTVWLFIDGPRGQIDNESIHSVKHVAKNYDHIINKNFISEKNLGLKESLVRGIKKASKSFDGFIIVEDDIIFSSQALTYAKSMLDDYNDDSSIMHINIWNYPVIKSDTPYFSSYMHCWGWASWSKKWHQVDFSSNVYKRQSFYNRIKISKYFSTLHFSHLYANFIEKKNTWAIFWLTHIVESKGKCISPPESLSKNIGFLSGENKEFYNFKQIDSKRTFAWHQVKKSYSNELISWIYSIYMTPILSLLNSIRIIFFK
jgi:hypothetical protein